MADEADNAGIDIEATLARDVQAVREAAKAIPKGSAGTCKECGQKFLRIVRGHCGHCRDVLGLP